MGKHVYTKTALTGGGDTALDGIDGNLLNNLDIGIVTAAGVIYFYVLNNDLTTAESSPGIISPDKNYGTKRWILQGGNFENLGIGTSTPASLLTLAVDGVDNTNYGRGLQIIRAAANTGQHIALIRQGTAIISLGYVYNTSIFAIGSGQATDSNFAGSNILFAIDPTGGKVGIGTAAPGNKVHIIGSGNTSGTFALFVQNSDLANNFYVRDDGLTHIQAVYVFGNVSAASYTTRSKYPESTKQAYDSITSVTGKDGTIEHGPLDTFIQGTPDKDAEGKETPTLDIGATLACLVEVVKDLKLRLEQLEKI